MKKIALLILILLNFNLKAQEKNLLDYSNPQSYEIGGIMINGAENLNNNTLISIANLTIGENIKID